MLGGDQSFNVQDPTLGLHYIIAETGVFPSSTGIVPDGDPFLGEISLFAGTTAPAGWAFADGQLLSIAQYPALFSVFGTTYGGNGIFNFALPDLMDRVAVGTGDGINLGEMFGADSDTLDFARIAGRLPDRSGREQRPRTADFGDDSDGPRGTRLLTAWQGCRAPRDRLRVLPSSPPLT